MRNTLFILTLTALLLAATAAMGQDDPDYVPEAIAKANDDERPQGWDFTLTIGASGSLNQNTKVVGQTDGTTYTLGGKLDFGADYNKELHEVRNRIAIQNTWTRTAQLEEFIRSSDSLEIESVYYYHLESVPWLGPFARLQLRTSVFSGQDVQPGPVTYSRTDLDGNAELITAERLDLTDPFAPLTLKQSVGGFARPIDKKWLGIESRLGVGAQQTFASGNFAIQDNEDTPEIEVVALDDSVQAGLEFVTTAGGSILGKRITYATGVEVLVPFVNDLPKDDDRSAFDLTNVELYAKASFKIVEWASLDYEFRALRQPVLLEDFQIQNNVLLTFGYTLLGDEDE